ncbi:YggS family pyridoxal phosphate-dependent enzyme [Anaerotignum lactatifermentans]|uniref:Pyridoxal phosphate homeostasis protein n=1 Tax=Anaerotignum lactatifermentans TaxID=160404 RepID=A0ABS2G8W5_9FIRM|nr:YggS family pyridoxal phosphate-dependent enzyme [Anaerotignum lactatifermentans]MBM6828892.1 YggS family pyridoxal phosphate-dependent enzyme [Anaerotignum lactatifermentans]MBM6876934.1 YggS family pyridoxal phosphate-dependent enzyme [Anaerotignum lactatifermentans]MBM6950493.1 YggS family pyridoxal phosphate-dependent enzyme [Anaerotignum lactatifermentans]
MQSIKENIRLVEEKVCAAAQRSGRKQEDVLLLAVSKTKPVETIREAVECGLTSLGENKVQEIMEKYEPMGPGVHWHLIGHLQTNKVKYIIDKVDMIHSVDSLRLAEEIDKRGAAKDIVMPVLIEVNMADEESKFGVKPEEVETLLRQLSSMSYICVKGLMTVAPFVEDPEENRVYFRKMRELLVDMNAKKIDNIIMDQLSMGMTGDYEVAIEEGATIVRVGTGIFGERYYPDRG